MKIQITYQPRTITVDVDSIVDNVLDLAVENPDGRGIPTDEQINREILEDIADTDGDREWPSIVVSEHDRDTIRAAVHVALEQRRAEALALDVAEHEDEDEDEDEDDWQVPDDLSDEGEA